MTIRRWFYSLIRFAAALGLLWYAVHAIHSGWGLAILAMVYLMGFLWLVDTVDLLFGRWIRRGPVTPIVLSQAPPPQRIRRVIIEEIVP